MATLSDHEAVIAGVAEPVGGATLAEPAIAGLAPAIAGAGSAAGQLLGVRRR